MDLVDAIQKKNRMSRVMFYGADGRELARRVFCLAHQCRVFAGLSATAYFGIKVCCWIFWYDATGRFLGKQPREGYDDRGQIEGIAGDAE